MTDLPSTSSSTTALLPAATPGPEAGAASDSATSSLALVSTGEVKADVPKTLVPPNPGSSILKTVDVPGLLLPEPSNLTAEKWRRGLAVYMILVATGPLALVCLFVYWIADQPISWERLVARAITVASLVALSAFLFSLVEKLTRPLWLVEKLASLKATAPNSKGRELLTFSRELIQLLREGKDLLDLGDGKPPKAEEPKK